MRGAKRAEKAEVPLIGLKEIWKGSPRNNASHTMANKVDDNVLLFLLIHMVFDISLNLFCEVIAHLFDVAVSVVLIGPRNQVLGIG